MEIDDLVSLLKQDRSHFEHRYVKELGDVKGVVDAVRAQGLRIVLTSGSFDVIHEGHSMYLEAARDKGDFLVVGVDSDSKVRERKGPTRPAVPETERLRMVTHQRGVGMVTLKSPEHERWALIHAVRPDVLVATEETYSPEDIAELERTCCGKVDVLPRMATVSTSARLRTAYFEIANVLAQRLPTFINNIVSEIAGER